MRTYMSRSATRSMRPAGGCRITRSASTACASSTHRRHRRSDSSSSSERAHYFIFGRKAATCLLRISQLAVDGDFKHPATGLVQGHLRLWLRLSDQICRLTGARFVSSHAAVFDLDLHEGA